MTESARKVADEAEHRLDNLAEDVRHRFDRLTKGRFADQVRAGRFSGGAARDAAEDGRGGGQAGHGAGQARSDEHRRERGGPR